MTRRMNSSEAPDSRSFCEAKDLGSFAELAAEADALGAGLGVSLEIAVASGKIAEKMRMNTRAARAPARAFAPESSEPVLSLRRAEGVVMDQSRFF